MLTLFCIKDSVNIISVGDAPDVFQRRIYHTMDERDFNKEMMLNDGTQGIAKGKYYELIECGQGHFYHEELFMIVEEQPEEEEHSVSLYPDVFKCI